MTPLQPQKSPQLIAALHTLESVGISAAITFVTGFFQAVGMNGLNWPVLGTVATSLFIGCMTQIYKSLKGNPLFVQQIIGFFQQLYASHVALTGKIDALSNQIAGQTPVVINNHPAALPAVSTPIVQQTGSAMSPVIPARPQFAPPPTVPTITLGTPAVPGGQS